MSFFENIQGVFETQFGTLPRPEGGGSTGGAGDWNTLANRPFGYVEHYDLLPETTVQFSGGNPAIGGLALTSPLTEGKAYPVNFDGTQYLCKYESGKLGNLALEDGTDTGEPFLWYVTESMILTTAGAGRHTVSIQGDVPQKVPEEYLNPPDWNKMVNRPFGYEEKRELLPETTLTFEANESFGGMVCAMFMLSEVPIAGSTQTIRFNDQEYTCICYEGDGSLAIGNIDLIEGTGDSGEPFVIMIMPDAGIAIVLPTNFEPGSATMQWEGGFPVLVPENYLPGFDDLVYLDFSDQGTVTQEEQLLIPFDDPDILVKAARRGLIRIRLKYSIKTSETFFPSSTHVASTVGNAIFTFNISQIDDVYAFIITSVYRNTVFYVDYMQDGQLRIINRRFSFV